VAPRLLQKIAADRILRPLNRFAPLSSKGEPARALWGTYAVAGMLVLIGELNMVAPLLSMCFLVTYSFMNMSCFTLTFLNSTSFRPNGIQKKRWRFWYMGTGSFGFIICVTIMFTIDHFWALGVFALAISLYMYINWTLEAREWGSALDGIRFNLALQSLIQIEESQHHTVNWRPQVLILYRVHLSEELKGIKHHEILKFYSHLRKGQGFCVVACVLEADQRDEHAIHKAAIEKGIIKSIMKEEGIKGFAEVVVAPSWVEGTNYIIQLTGIGGLSPNTVILDWPENWKKHTKKASDFCNVLKVALANDKAVLAMKGIADLPMETVHGTIDVWWMIHDGGFLILLAYLLVQHKVWRRCHLRVFTITEGVTQEKAQLAAKMLTKTLRQRRLFDVDVEVILADHEMLENYTYDRTLKAEERRKYMEQLHELHPSDPRYDKNAHMLTVDEIDDIFQMDDDEVARQMKSVQSVGASDQDLDDELAGHIAVSDVRGQDLSKFQRQMSTTTADLFNDKSPNGTGGTAPDKTPSGELPPRAVSGELPLSNLPVTADELPRAFASKTSVGSKPSVLKGLTSPVMKPDTHKAGETNGSTKDESTHRQESAQRHAESMASFIGLNQIIQPRSKRAELVIMTLPDLWSTEDSEIRKFMSYCDALTKGLDRVMFVHSTGHEIFDIAM